MCRMPCVNTSCRCSRRVFSRTAWLLRGKGGAQIEVALDVGAVVAGERSQPICEIELELKSGQPDALFALALEWAAAFDCLPFDISKAERGVRLAHGVEAAPVKSVPLALDDGMGVEEGFAAIVQACLAQFQANLPGVLASGDIEYVHQARVALRRLRAALRLFRDACVLPPDLLESLRALAAALGPARDWDVLCSETLPAIAPHYPDAESWQRGMQALEARRIAVRTAMRDALAQAPPGRLAAGDAALAVAARLEWGAGSAAFRPAGAARCLGAPGAAEGASSHRSRRARFRQAGAGAAPRPAHRDQAPALCGRVFPVDV